MCQTQAAAPALSGREPNRRGAEAAGYPATTVGRQAGQRAEANRIQTAAASGSHWGSRAATFSTSPIEAAGAARPESMDAPRPDNAQSLEPKLEFIQCNK